MILLEYHGKRPKIGKNVYIAPGAVIIGDVEIGDDSSIWFNTVVRADLDAIRIGRNTNIQDNCTIHLDVGKPAIIGDNVTVGHNAVVHGCIIEDDCLIGINSTVLSGAHVKRGTIVASNALVREGQVIGPFQLVTGVPAEVKKHFDESVLKVIRSPAESYREKALHYRDLKPLT